MVALPSADQSTLWQALGYTSLNPPLAKWSDDEHAAELES